MRPFFVIKGITQSLADMPESLNDVPAATEKLELRILFAHNVHSFGEGREIELPLSTLIPKLNKDIKFSLCSSALLLPSLHVTLKAVEAVKK
jgi:hypothetical protein